MRVVLFVLVVLLVLSAAAPSRRPPDILLITIDTLRADAPGFASNRRTQTPVLDRLAAQGRVFTNTHAHNVVTLPSHVNILTGLYPYQHGVRDNSGFRLSADVPTLATVLKAAGYATGAFVGAYPLDSEFGLDHGFKVYDDRTTRGSEDDFGMAERRGDEVVAPALAWWNGQRGKPRFLWVHLYDPHAPYSPPEPFASRYKTDPYLGEVAASDSFLAPLLNPFLEGKEPPAVVAVTADHGEGLGEHGELTHGLFAYEATLKVPLVLWGQGIKAGKDPRPARHVDLFPTLLQASGVNPPAFREARPGRSLLAAPAEQEVTYFESLSTNLNRGWAPLRGVLREGRKLIALPLPELYDLPKDPAEQENRIDDERPTARALIAALPEESSWPPRRQASGDEERLRSLGYLSGSAPARASYGPEDDPKNLIQLDAKISRVIELYSLRRLEGALALAREVVKERPSMPLGRSLLAQALLETGRTGEALDVMRKARADGVTTESLLRQLGLTLSEHGKTEEALDVLRPMAETGEPRSRHTFALVLSEAGRQKEAYEVLRKLLADDPNDAKAFEQMGLIELRLGHWQQARDLSRKAVELRPALSLAWNDLGVALYQLGQPGEALDAWQRAVELKPDLWDALWNLGLKAAEHGRPKQARAALERFVAGAPSRYSGDVQKARTMLERLP
ncbi:MAG TPA: sulfatase-like hydrolase/transferase [Thermoanaerobaculia bacterium]|nr:sulfatase-like hydrolase/transferase [Thermoanaerobaculia bacterium]